jgi:hypothetical protein
MPDRLQEGREREHGHRCRGHQRAGSLNGDLDHCDDLDGYIRHDDDADHGHRTDINDFDSKEVRFLQSGFEGRSSGTRKHH